MIEPASYPLFVLIMPPVGPAVFISDRISTRQCPKCSTSFVFVGLNVKGTAASPLGEPLTNDSVCPVCFIRRGSGVVELMEVGRFPHD